MLCAGRAGFTADDTEHLPVPHWHEQKQGHDNGENPVQRLHEVFGLLRPSRQQVTPAEPQTGCTAAVLPVSLSVSGRWSLFSFPRPNISANPRHHPDLYPNLKPAADYA